MKNQFLFFFLLIISVTTCSKDEINVKNQVGTWTGIELQKTTIDGNIIYEVTVNFNLELKEDGNGVFGSDKDVHWVLDEGENKIFLIREFISGGQELFTTTRFDIDENTESKQVWTMTTSITNVNGETEERYTKWTLSK